MKAAKPSLGFDPSMVDDLGYGWGRRGQGGYGRGGYGRGRGGWGGWGGQAGYAAVPLPPPKPGVTRIAAPIEADNGLKSPISMIFARSPYMAFVDIEGGRVVNVNIMPNPGINAPGGAGMMMARWLISSGVKIVLAPQIGPNAQQVLVQAGVEVRQIQPGHSLEEALRGEGLLA